MTRYCVFKMENKPLLCDKCYEDMIMPNINTCTCPTNDQSPGDWHDANCPNFLEPDSGEEIAAESGKAFVGTIETINVNDEPAKDDSNGK